MKNGLALRLRTRFRLKNWRSTPDDAGRGQLGFTAGIEETLLFAHLP